MPLNGSTSAGEISAIADTAVASNRVLTIPNVLSFLRLVGVPFFFALILLRFFDEDLGFVFRGVVFVLLGLAFLVVNLVLARKKGAAP